MTIYIVRHGQTQENMQRMLQGHLPGVLTDLGRSQIAQAALTLAAEPVNFSCIVSSDLQRAIDSAQIIANQLNLPIITTPQLRERDWGNYTGMPLTEALCKYKKRGKWVLPDGSAESEEDIFNRAKSALQQLKEQYAGQTIIVVTHGQLARNLIAAHLGCSTRMVPPMQNAEIRKFEV
ncbi:MAG: histidine phosphatase family protein [Muribaculaceae bacterium]